MKLKNMIFSGMLALSLWLSLNCTVVNRNRARINVGWATVNNEVRPNNIEEIVQYQRTCLFSSNEIFHDDWKSPKRTHEEGYGDCEDFALSSAYFAEKLGYCPKIMILKSNSYQSNHALTLLEEKSDGKTFYGYIDYLSYSKPIFTSLDAVVCAMNNKYSSKKAATPWKDAVVIDLSKVKFDWRFSDKNLRDKFIDLYSDKVANSP